MGCLWRPSLPSLTGWNGIGQRPTQNCTVVLSSRCSTDWVMKPTWLWFLFVPLIHQIALWSCWPQIVRLLKARNIVHLSANFVEVSRQFLGPSAVLAAGPHLLRSVALTAGLFPQVYCCVGFCTLRTIITFIEIRISPYSRFRDDFGEEVEWESSWNHVSYPATSSDIVQKSLAWQHSISHWKTGHRPFPTIVIHDSLHLHIATLGIALSSSFFFAHKHCNKDVRRSGEQTPWEKMVADFCHEFELCKQIQTPPIWQWSCSSFIEPLQHAHALFSTGHRPVIIPLQLH